MCDRPSNTMTVTSQQLSVTCGSAQLCFAVGQFSSVVQLILEKGQRKSQVVLPCTLYDLARVSSDQFIASEYQKVDYLTTDGMPLVWWFRTRLEGAVERVYGPDILAHVILNYPNSKFTILCPNDVVLSQLEKKFSEQINNNTAQLVLVGDSRNPHERKRLVSLIKPFAPSFVWIGVGSPNQVLLGTYLRDALPFPITYWCVGAAIPFLAGTVNQAPRWMQQNGLEWFFRLLNEPHRLWQRYLVITPLFLFRLLFARIKSIRG